MSYQFAEAHGSFSSSKKDVGDHGLFFSKAFFSGSGNVDTRFIVLVLDD